ncbi:uncharacterized protein MONOS_569 [Monocercomonoides exilis]|uniref:uncharacterized protein n=1 Tax=Monocercomonoides exilis TaxID=2049356 RepID=UPI0035596D59|nr:hypothetical protein MONOS_569 [Monocercomonoides exilis]|eukprot:MONOS_569.1-p1 / transcript=MONOS_569.1 / gene=MONOS_569 / organism=Monocercomonoides_exilis_PA203 / gene_product=unspecified product / transcript_product=unspecified product / location=Mono_scaffold00009:80979-82124(-) / protein_length=343 / sequence_SO=supercontig / SO=protein_coding / is_pseudo=false
MSQRLIKFNFPRIDEIMSVEPWNLPSSSQIRLELLEFLMSVIDPHWQTLIPLSSKWSTYQKMTYICSLWGMCTTDNVALLQGLSNIQSQKLFFELLLDLAESSLEITQSEELDHVMKRDNEFLGLLIENHFGKYPNTQKYANKSLTTIKLQLFPPDVIQKIKGLVAVPTEQYLLSSLSSIEEQIRVNKTYIPEKSNQELSSTGVPFEVLVSTLRDVLSNLKYLVVSASQSFRIAFDPWIRSTDTTSTETGKDINLANAQNEKLSVRVLRFITTFESIFNALDRFDQSIYNIITKGKQIEDKIEKRSIGKKGIDNINNLTKALSSLMTQIASVLHDETQHHVG